MSGGEGIVQDVARFVSDLEYDGLPAASIDAAEDCFVDTVGVMVPGVESRPASILRDTVVKMGDGPARLFGSDETAPLLDAVLFGGTVAHALDFDDGTSATLGHPSAPVVPTILAFSEVETITGAEALTAYVAGFETMSFLAKPILSIHKRLGWHSTTTFGTLGSAAASAKLLGCTADEVANALNLAVSMGSSLNDNFGTMTKSYHAGKAARSGAFAAQLASRGFTASADAFTGRTGFYALYSGGGSPDYTTLHALGDRWSLVEDGVRFKAYPCCGHTHNAIDAAKALHREHGIRPGEIAEVRVETSRTEREFLVYDAPETVIESRFSMPYTVAVALVTGDVGLDSFEADRLDDAVVADLVENTTFTVDESLLVDRRQAAVTVRTTDGETVRHLSAEPPGSLSTVELRSKFANCVEDHLSEREASELLDATANLRRVEDVREIVDAVA